MKQVTYENAVFINCPFDDAYSPMLRAIIFTVMRCGFMCRSALEEDNGLQNRLDKIQRIIEDCQYGIHDISRTELNTNSLPRFNMPFELGLFFGAHRFGDAKQKNKNAVIFDTQRFRYQEFISDLNGVDIKAHQNKPEIAIQKLRNWLSTASGKKPMVGENTIIAEYKELSERYPALLQRLGVEDDNLTFNDYCLIVEEHLNQAS
jgi:hypothetical protein